MDVADLPPYRAGPAFKNSERPASGWPSRSADHTAEVAALEVRVLVREDIGLEAATSEAIEAELWGRSRGRCRVPRNRPLHPRSGSVTPLSGAFRRTERAKGFRRDAPGMVKERRERPDALIRKLISPSRHCGSGDAVRDLLEDISGIVPPTGAQQIRRRRDQPLDSWGDAWRPMTLDAVLPKQTRSGLHRLRCLEICRDLHLRGCCSNGGWHCRLRGGGASGDRYRLRSIRLVHREAKRGSGNNRDDNEAERLGQTGQHLKILNFMRCSGASRSLADVVSQRCRSRPRSGISKAPIWPKDSTPPVAEPRTPSARGVRPPPAARRSRTGL
ncbi:MAG: hypothetical protein JWR00_2697 [Rubritepida sp.]|nr:hypothetical protein [Rubritepida sp.]